MAWHSWATLRGYFTQDDFIFIYSAGHHSLSLSYLFARHAGVHIMPGQFLLIWLVTRIAPLNYTVAVIPLLVLQALSVALLWRVLVRLFDHSILLLVPFALYALSPLVFVSTLWWAVSLQLTPFFVVLFASVDHQVRFVQTGVRRHAWLALAWVAVGVLFWEKAVVLILVLFGFSIALSSSGSLPQRVVRTVRRHWWLWSTYIAAAAAYALVYTLNAPASATQTTTTGSQLASSQTVDLAHRMIVNVLLPGIFGGPWNGHLGEVNTPSPTLLVLAFGLVALAVGTSVARRGSRAAIAWVVLGLYLVLDVALLAVARLHAWGPGIGSFPRFVADAVPIVTLCGALALLPLKGESDSASTPPERPSTWSDGELVALGLAAILVVGAVFTTAMSTSLHENAADRRFVASATSAIKRNPGLVLFDGAVPADVLSPLFGPDWRASRVIGVTRPRPKFDLPTADLMVLDDLGVPRPVALTYAVHARPGPAKDCGYAVGAGATAIGLDVLATGKHLVVEVIYFIGRSGDGRISSGNTSVRAHFEAGGVRAFYFVADGPFDKVAVEAPPGNVVCIARVTVGAAVPG